MWVFDRRSGNMMYEDEVVGTGYSGRDVGKNNPAFEWEESVGPIPAGMYTLGAPVDTVRHGKYVMTLTPFPENKMYGRSGFLCHGDSIEHPGQASEGCIIQARSTRERMWESNDHTLKVV